MTTGPKRAKPVVASSRAASSPGANALRRAEELTESFKMLGNANRLKIVVFLDERERSVGEIEAVLAIRQPTLSQQLAELRDAGLIAGRKAAKSVIYSLTPGLGRRALETVYLASGHVAPRAATPVRQSSHQAAVFAAVLAPRGTRATALEIGRAGGLQGLAPAVRPLLAREPT